MNKVLVSIFITATIVGAGAFYGGMKYANGKNLRAGQNFRNISSEERQQRSQESGGNGNFRNRTGRQQGGFVAGEIINKDDKSIIVKIRDGGSKIIFYSNTSEVGKFVNGAFSDLEVGKNVSISGVSNSDGSITAESIQLIPVSKINRN